MAYMNIDITYNKELFMEHFLKAGRPFAPNFYNHWARAKIAAGKELKFREITRDQGGLNKQRKTYKDKKCICGQIHLFEDDPYLNINARTPGWKSIPSEQKTIWEAIKKNTRFYFAIKKFCNTDILEGITVENNRSRGRSRDSSKDNNKDTVMELPASANLAYADLALPDNQLPNTYKNLLKNSIQYDPCSTYHLTWDRSRFINNIWPEFEWISSPGGNLLIEGCGTMLVKAHLNGKNVDLKFPNTAYTPTSNCTLIAGMKLKREEYHWDMSIDKVTYKGTPIFDVDKHFGMPVVKYRPIRHVAAYVNYVGPRSANSVPRATSWVFHQRLCHYQPEVIKQLVKCGDIELLEDKDSPKMVQCQTCAMLKMHQFILKILSQRATRLFKRLCMDLIILGVAWDGTTYIAHFYDECIRNHWVFPMSDHKQEMLLHIVKHIINHCDRQGFESRFAVQVIQQDQETSVGNDIQRLVQSQGLTYEWSAKDTKEQNGAAERTDN
ncbi:MAG: hypothetical protein FRX48_07185 [Lasallia pustulata]|uniref:Uncharacterized protein n=1 Tax=Lasallia pustulata TaxID=136370 RepID=A0A5M8PHH5_9LECA|nr:MAG: hypothetical protein FRX48_07185 [Lasallia pustulata]